MVQVQGFKYQYRYRGSSTGTGTGDQVLVQVQGFKYWYRYRGSSTGTGTGVQVLVQVQGFKYWYRYRGSSSGRLDLDPTQRIRIQPKHYDQKVEKKNSHKTGYLISARHLNTAITTKFCYATAQTALYVQEVVTLQKKYQIYLHQKMRFTAFFNYYDILG